MICACDMTHSPWRANFQVDLFIWYVRLTWRMYIQRDLFMSEMTYSYDMYVLHDAFKNLARDDSHMTF